MPPDSTEDVAGAVLWAAGSTGLGGSIAAVGDFDGDGASEVVVTEQDRGWIVRGTEARLEGEVAVDEVGVAIPTLGIYPRAVGLGDLDADGFGDFAVAVQGPSHIEGDDEDVREAIVLLFYGGQGRLDGDGPAGLEPDAVLHRPAGAWSGLSIDLVDDFDGDGHADLVVGDMSLAGGAGGAYLVRGDGTRRIGDPFLDDLAAPWYGATRVLVREQLDDYGEPYERRDASEDRAGYRLAAGDIDADGLSDVFVGAPTDGGAGELGGRVYVIAGSAE